MKKAIPLLALISFLTVATAPAAILFNPANPLSVVDEGGFTGSVTGAEDPFVEALVRFSFSGLNPSPLSSSFQISGISLEGDGISTSLSFSNVTITGNGSFSTSFVSLNNSISNLNFANTRVSFNLPGGGVINDGALLTVTARYRSGVELDQLTSSTGPTFEAVPEPSTYALLALAAVGLAAYRWRQRSKATA
jgi:hypothetical protein